MSLHPITDAHVAQALGNLRLEADWQIRERNAIPNETEAARLERQARNRIRVEGAWNFISSSLANPRIDIMDNGIVVGRRFAENNEERLSILTAVVNEHAQLNVGDMPRPGLATRIFFAGALVTPNWE